MVLAALAVQALLLAQVPSYATPAREQTLHGTIAGFDGKYHLRLRDERGWFDDVTLHQGTVITPRGLRLQPGMRVTIRGAADGATFDADEIEAPDESAPGTSYDDGMLYGAPYGWGNTLYPPYGGYYYPPYGVYAPGTYVGPPQIYVIPVPVARPTPAPPHRSYRRPLTVPQAPPHPAPPPRAAPPHPAPRPPAASTTHHR